MTDTFVRIVHGGDYNPDQWLHMPGIIDDDMRLMKLAHMNSATIGIFSWSKLEPEDGIYSFEWLDEIMDKLYKNGIDVILATPSGARPAWLAKKYPEVLRTDESGIRNEYGVRHNHCLTSTVYRKKVMEINTQLAKRYASHPALKMWHISNEYSGECHCELCQEAFRQWLKEYYHDDLSELNRSWWTGFWSHDITDWDQIHSPKYRGECCVPAMKLCWDRFVTDSHISFYENEIAPLREYTPDIPITTNLMRLYNRIDYQKLAKHLDLVSWDNYPGFDGKDNLSVAAETAFCHDAFRSMKEGKPFFMMESTPSIVNGREINKLPQPGIQTMTALQAVAHGSDSVQYFQWRKGRGGFEKFHGAVVDHSGRDDTRVFKEVSETGKILEKLLGVKGKLCQSKVAIICDWENSRAVNHFSGYNNKHRDYFNECIKWYRPFWEEGICEDIISMDDDFSKYDLIIAPFLYMLKDGTEKKIRSYVQNGGHFVMTYLSGITDKNDLCYLGGYPAGSLKDVFGITVSETDSLSEDCFGLASFKEKEYKVQHICDVIESKSAKVLGTYKSDFYAGTPAVTVNEYGKGRAYYVSFRNDEDLAEDFCEYLLTETNIKPDADIPLQSGVILRKRGEYFFVMNFTNEDKSLSLDKEYLDVLNNILVHELNIKALECKVLKVTEDE